MKSMRIRIVSVLLACLCFVSLSLALATRAVAQEIRLDLNGLTILPANWNTISSNTTVADLADFVTGVGTGVDVTTANFEFYAFDPNIWTAGGKGWVAENGGKGAGFRTSAGTATVTFDNLPGGAYRVQVVASNRTDFRNSIADIQVNGSFADADKNGTGENGDDYPLDGNGHNNWLIWNAVAPSAGQIQVSMAYASGGNGTVINAIRLVPSAQAQSTKSLFRVERMFYGAPQPPATSPGGAGIYQKLIQPHTSRDAYGNYLYPPAIATVQPGNPIGGAFTLPTGFITYQGTFMTVQQTGWLGFTTYTYVDYYNGPGHFGPSNPYAATTTTRIVFPTTMGNAIPNYGLGSPVTPTTTFSGRYDSSRAGSINVTPGPSRFGGTFKLFYGPTAGFYQHIDYFTPLLYKAYGSARCQDPPGSICTPSVVSSIGDFTSSGMATRFLLNTIGTGTGKGTQRGTAKATTPISLGPGTFPTQYGNASYVAAKHYYLHTIHPWTTGFASAHNPLQTPTAITPQAKGYDTTLGGNPADITVTHVYTSVTWNPTLMTVTYPQFTRKQHLTGVTRVVSMVRPRLVHAYTSQPGWPSLPALCRANYFWHPRNVPPAGGRCAQAAQLYTMKVFFLPEPTGLLLLAAGLGCLVALYRVRGR